MVKEEEESLNGDDVPLCEEVMGEMTEGSDPEDGSVSSSIDGDSFPAAVSKANVGMMLKQAEKERKAVRKVVRNGAIVELDANGQGDAEDEDGEEEEAEFAKSLREAFKLPDKKKNGVKRKSPEEEEASSPQKSKKKKPNNKKLPKDQKEFAEPPVKPLGNLERGSVEVGRARFEWMIHPVTVDQFLGDTFERRPLHIKRGKKGYYKEVFSTKEFDHILRHQRVVWGKNLDVVSYKEEEGRQTHNLEGRAVGPVVWDFYNNGCSIRMINPQTFSESVWRECATLQEFLGSMVGANVYLTPPGTQGFAPHYDDVEVFILQLEGKKHWKAYEPRNKQEELPRYSSPNFGQGEIGEPCLDLVLEAGDLLYLPRGTIHQGHCLPDAHSMHVTISCHQLNSYGDLLERALPAALKSAMAEDVEFRRGLPLDYLRLAGAAVSEGDLSSKLAAARREFLGTVERLARRVAEEFMSVDHACDEMGKRLVRDALPPHLTDRERARTVEGDGERWHAAKGRVVNRVELDPDTQVRLLRAHCLRLVREDGACRIYISTENTREYHEAGEELLEVEPDKAPALEALVRAYPAFVRAESLPLEDLAAKMALVQDLWEKKLIMTRDPLEAHYDD